MREGEYEKFEVPDVTKAQIDQLQAKLNSVVWPNELEENYGWSYGAPTWAVKPLVEEWAHSFDWQELKTTINRWHHYRMRIDDLLVHFIHEPSSNPDAIPIVLLHGWPSTFYEFYKLIEPLRDGANNGQSFHVVVPSLPGYGYSEAPKVKGYGVKKMASIINRLMINLGYDKYLHHGGDWGGIIGRQIALKHNNHCAAFHTNLPMALPTLPTPRNLLFHPWKVIKFLLSIILGFKLMYGKGKVNLAGATFANAERNYDCGYRSIQGTKPYTLAYGLSDSPVGLLGWMLEKYHDWTCHPAERRDTEALPPTISSKEFLTQVSIYWITNTMSSSIRIYYECLHQNELRYLVPPRIKIPMGVSAFDHDVFKLPRDWIATSGNLHQYTETDCGGHFPSLEEPQILLSDIQRFGRHLRQSHIL